MERETMAKVACVLATVDEEGRRNGTEKMKKK